MTKDKELNNIVHEIARNFKMNWSSQITLSGHIAVEKVNRIIPTYGEADLKEQIRNNILDNARMFLVDYIDHTEQVFDGVFAFPHESTFVGVRHIMITFSDYSADLLKLQFNNIKELHINADDVGAIFSYNRLRVEITSRRIK